MFVAWLPPFRRCLDLISDCSREVACFGTSAKPSICFVAHFAYGELAGVDTEHVGGIEHQQALMARWLAREGYRVSLLTWDAGQGDGQTATGVTVYKMCRLDAGFRVLRFVHPRWTSLWRALTRADADI